MNRFALAISAALCTVALVACSGAPGSSIALPSGLPTVPPIPSEVASLAGQGLDDACDESSDTSLSGVAERLRSLGENPDTGEMIDAIATLSANLQQVDAQGAEAARDEAINQLREMQSALAEPGTASEVANTTADALESLEAEVCA